MMNKMKYWMIAAVTILMAACSNDDEPGIDKGGQKGELIDAISIAFTSARIPLSIILGGIMGLDGIWWAISSTSIVKGIIFTCTFLWITRKRPSQT